VPRIRYACHSLKFEVFFIFKGLKEPVAKLIQVKQLMASVGYPLGVVEKPEDYLCSSARNYVGMKGLISVTLLDPLLR